MSRAGWLRCIVAAPGPSLTASVARLVNERQRDGWKIIAANDAYRLLPAADVLYAADRQWWEFHDPPFAGEKWSSTSQCATVDDDKHAWGKAERYRLQLIRAHNREGFSFEPDTIHYGWNTGFQAVNLALRFGAKHVKLVGFDMRRVDGRTHFYGESPPEIRRGTNFGEFIRHFATAARLLPAGYRIENCTPDSALTCFASAAL